MAWRVSHCKYGLRDGWPQNYRSPGVQNLQCIDLHDADASILMKWIHLHQGTRDINLFNVWKHSSHPQLPLFVILKFTYTFFNTRYQPQSNKDWTWLLLILWGHLRSLLFHNDCLANGVHIKGTCMERKVDDVTRWIWIWTKLQALIVTKISRSGRCPPRVFCNNQIDWFLTERRCWSWFHAYAGLDWRLFERSPSSLKRGIFKYAPTLYCRCWLDGQRGRRGRRSPCSLFERSA